MYKIINKKKLIATVAADIVGAALCRPLNYFKKKESIIPERIKEILVIRTAYTGDVVMTLPILKPLKTRFPFSRITFFTSTGSKEVLVNNPFVDDIITYDPFWFYPGKKALLLKFVQQLKKRRFDLVLEARGDIREILFFVWPVKARFKVSYGVGGGAYLLTHVVPYKKLKHKIEFHLDLVRYLGCMANGKEWGIYLTNGEKEAVRKVLIKEQIEKPFLCAHPGGRLALKRWPIEKCARLYDRIINDFKITVVLVGSQQEEALVTEIVKRMRNEPVNLTGKLNLRILSGVLAECVLFIGNDSAPMHIADAMKTPTVAIFGPSKSRETGPYGNKSLVVEKNFPCRFTCDESICKHNVYNECINAVTTDDVLNAVKEMLK